VLSAVPLRDVLNVVVTDLSAWIQIGYWVLWGVFITPLHAHLLGTAVFLVFGPNESQTFSFLTR
jgi:hypothetical protein